VAQNLRSDPETRHVLIVGVSGYGQDDHRVRSKDSGFDHHIVKPVDPPHLIGLLQSLAAQRVTVPSPNVLTFPQRRQAE